MRLERESHGLLSTIDRAMADTPSNEPRLAPVAPSSRPVSEALLNDKVRIHDRSL